MSGRFTGKIAAVTGAASGIGLAAAARLAAEGAEVVLLDLDEARLRKSVDGLPGLHRCRVLDVSDEAATAAVFDWIGEASGGLDILVNSAGIGAPRVLGHFTRETWRRTFAVNMEGTLFCTQGAMPLMQRRGGGSIINVASVSAKRLSHHGGADYTASKSAVLGFTRQAAFELSIHRIRVNAICPGVVRTPMVEAVSTAEQREATAARIPMGRLVEPEDVAGAIAFLASDDALMVTGSTVDVDGGLMVASGEPHHEYFARRGQHR